MSALAELQSGAPGAEFVSLLERTVLAVALSRNFPPPDGGAWTKAAVRDVVSEFFADTSTPRRLADLALHCGDEQALRARLQGAVRNFLRDLGRATEVGRLVVRLRRALRSSDEFQHLPEDRWTLAGGEPAAASGANPDSLRQAAANVEITVPKWSSSSRAGPYADRESIEALLRAVLTAAKGSLTAGDLARAIAPRLGVSTSPLVVELDAGDYPESSMASLVVDETGFEVANKLRALEVLALLSDRQRIALACIDRGVRELGPLMGVGPSQAQVIRKHAGEVLKEELVGEDDGQAIAELVLDLAKAWIQDRTTTGNSTYERA